MKAIILLGLLHVAFGQYSWNGPDHVDLSPDPNEGNACWTDEGSCGCCLMMQEMNRLRTYFNMSLNKLEKECSKTNQSLKNLEANRAAVSVALYSNNRFKCYGPFTFKNVIIYEHVFLNLGNGYNATTGIFTVPHSGVYSLAVTVYSDVGAPDVKLAACAGLQVNGVVVAGSTDKNNNDPEDSSSVVIALHLKANDKVAVSLPTGCFLCDDYSHYNTFSAFLLYPTE